MGSQIHPPSLRDESSVPSDTETCAFAVVSREPREACDDSLADPCFPLPLTCPLESRVPSSRTSRLLACSRRHWHTCSQELVKSRLPAYCLQELPLVSLEYRDEHECSDSPHSMSARRVTKEDWEKGSKRSDLEQRRRQRLALLAKQSPSSHATSLTPSILAPVCVGASSAHPLSSFLSDPLMKKRLSYPSSCYTFLPVFLFLSLSLFPRSCCR